MPSSATEYAGILLLVLIVAIGVGLPLFLASRGGRPPPEETHDDWFRRVGKWVYLGLFALAVVLAIALRVG